MAIIYSYPTVVPTSDDLVLGTDVNGVGKPTKNFTVQSLIDLIAGGVNGLGAVITANPSAEDANGVTQSATGFRNISGAGNLNFLSLNSTSIVNTAAITTLNLTATGIISGPEIYGTTFKTSAGSAASWSTTVLSGFTSVSTSALVISGAVSGASLIVSDALDGATDSNIASTLAIKTYVDGKIENQDTLAELLAKNPSPAANPSNTTGGTDILVSTNDDITFTDTSKIILGTGSDATIQHDGTDLKIINTEGKTTISNSSGDIDITATADTKKTNLNGKAGVELQFDTGKKLEVLNTGVTVTGITTSTGVFRGPDGTLALPSYTFSGDPDTGMFHPAANQISFSTEAGLRLKISNSGIDVTALTTTTTTSSTAITRFTLSTDAISGVLGIAAYPNNTMMPTNLAVKSYVDTKNAFKTLAYEGDTPATITSVATQNNTASTSITIAELNAGILPGMIIAGTGVTPPGARVVTNAGGTTIVVSPAITIPGAGTQDITFAQPFLLNLSNDSLDVAGGTNIGTVAAAVTANVGRLTINLDDNVTLPVGSGKGTYTGTKYTDGIMSIEAGVGSAFKSITTTINTDAENEFGFFGPLRANSDSTNYAAGVADQAVKLVAQGTASVGNDIQIYPTFSLSTNEVVGANATAIVLASIPINNQTPIIGQALTGTGVVAGTLITNVQVNTPTDKVTLTVDKQQTAGIAADTALTFTTSAPIYTSGGPIVIPTFLPNTTATSKLLTGLTNGTATPILNTNTILGGMQNLQAQITDIPRGLVYKGTWDARTQAEGGAAGDRGAPALADGVGVSGEFYIVANSGSVNLDGITDWLIGDWAIFVEVGATDTWQKIDNTSEITGGGGSAGDMAMFTSAQNIAPSIINQTGSAGSFKVTLGSNSDFTVTGDTQLGDANTDTTLVKGPLSASETIVLSEGFGVPLSDGASPPVFSTNYGAAGQALFSGGGAGTANIWKTVEWTLSDGTNTSTVSNGNTVTFAATGGLATGESSKTVTYEIDYLGTNNAILTATDLSTGTIALTDQIWFNDIGTGATANTIKHAPVSKLKDIINTYSWKLDVNGGTAATIADTNQVGFNNGLGIIQSLSTRDITTALRYEDSDNSGTIKNFIESAATVVPTAADFLIFGDQAGASAKNAVKKATIADIVDLGNETLKQVLANGNITDGTDIAVSAADDITFTDTSKAIFGTGGDLEIYHDGTHSYIQDTSGTGDLRIDTNLFRLRSANGGETMIRAFEDGAVILSHNNLDKLTTTSTGVSVTGNVSLSDNILFSSVNASDSALILTNEGSTGEGAIFMQAGTGGGSVGGSVTCYANARTGGKDGDIAVGLSDNANGQFRVNTSGIDVGTDVFTVSANGDTLITGDLTVDGAIIHGGGSSASGKGGTFTGSLSFSSAATISPLFSIKRPVTGSIIIQVMLTSGDSAAVSSSKAYTVAMQHSTVPVYNKLIDTGPKGSNDFDIEWTGGTTNTDTTSIASTTDTVRFTSSGPSFLNVNGTAVSGTGIPAGTVITDTQVGSSTVVLSNTVNVAAGATITFDNSDILICRAEANTTTQIISYTVDLGFDITTIATVKTATTV